MKTRKPIFDRHGNELVMVNARISKSLAESMDKEAKEKRVSIGYLMEQALKKEYGDSNGN